MLANDELWLVEEPPIDAPFDLLTIPEVRNHVTHELHDDELGLRSLLERPEALSKSWWRVEHARRRRARLPFKTARRRRDVLRAA
jgi:hypothetical protein